MHGTRAAQVLSSRLGAALSSQAFAPWLVKSIAEEVL
jgi:hypothetical protein